MHFIAIACKSLEGLELCATAISPGFGDKLLQLITMITRSIQCPYNELITKLSYVIKRYTPGKEDRYLYSVYT